MKVWLKDNSFCLHEFPIPGKAIILRHNMKSEWKSLFIASIVESSECTKENQKSLTLSFSSVNDFSRWEKELRGNLKGNLRTVLYLSKDNVQRFSGAMRAKFVSWGD